MSDATNVNELARGVVLAHLDEQIEFISVVEHLEDADADESVDVEEVHDKANEILTRIYNEFKESK